MLPPSPPHPPVLDTGRAAEVSVSSALSSFIHSFIICPEMHMNGGKQSYSSSRQTGLVKVR